MIYQQETFDAMNSIITEHLAQLRREVKRYNKIKGDQLVEYFHSYYRVDTYYSMLEMAEREMTELQKDIKEKMGEDVQSQQHLQPLLEDVKKLDEFIATNLPDIQDKTEGLTSAGTALLILQTMQKAEDQKDDEKKESK